MGLRGLENSNKMWAEAMSVAFPWSPRLLSMWLFVRSLHLLARCRQGRCPGSHILQKVYPQMEGRDQVPGLEDRASCWTRTSVLDFVDVRNKLLFCLSPYTFGVNLLLFKQWVLLPWLHLVNPKLEFIYAMLRITKLAKPVQERGSGNPGF